MTEFNKEQNNNESGPRTKNLLQSGVLKNVNPKPKMVPLQIKVPVLGDLERAAIKVEKINKKIESWKYPNKEKVSGVLSNKVEKIMTKIEERKHRKKSILDDGA